MSPRLKIPDYLQRALEEAGLPWSAENGSRHIKIRVAGKIATVISRGSIADGMRAKTLGDIKRVARSAEGGRP